MLDIKLFLFKLFICKL